MERKFQILLLGVPEIIWQGQPFAVPRRQARALLYCLADEHQPTPRDRLTFLLWPDTPETTARRNLTRLLSYLRSALPHPDLLLTTRAAVALNPDLAGSDTARFTNLCAANDSTGWEPAVSLYRGPFLTGFTLPDSPEFDQWLSQTQRQYEQTYLDVLHKLVIAKAGSGDHFAAIQYTQQYLASDDLAEEMHRQLIGLYAASGDRSAALRQYEQCAMILERELGVPPLPETRAAYEAARDGTSPPPPETLPKPEWATLPGLGLPLIGREDAWQALTEAYRRYQNGGVIFISGEVGVGKSRLMQEFATAQSGLVLTGNSHATGQTLPYQPLVQALRQALPLRDRWRNTLPIWVAELSRLLPELRSHVPDLPPPVEVAPAQAQAPLFEALSEVFASLATDSPVLLCLDAVHRADEATVGWLEYQTKRLAGSNICIVGTYRSHRAGALANWRRDLNRAGLAAPVRLAGLSETAVAELLHQAGVDQATAAPLARRIHAATGGNTFFVLETVRELLETGNISDDVADLPLPQTVRDAVLHRAARLTPLAQQVLAIAAVLSPHLTIEMLSQTSGRGELETVDSLEELLAHQLLQADGHAFRFQHDLARQAIYEDISPWRRRLLHRRAAEGIEQLYQAELAPFYPSLAHHWRRVIEGEPADPALVSKAIEYLQKAGEQAAHNHANQEAIAFFSKALRLLEDGAKTPDRFHLELALQAALGGSLQVVKGFGAPEVKQAYSRARVLCHQVRDTSQLFPVLWGLWLYYIHQAEHQIALELAEQLWSLAEQTHDQNLSLVAHRILGTTWYWQGELNLAREHLRYVIDYYQPQIHRTAAVFNGGVNPKVHCLAYGALVVGMMGYLDQALKMSQQALDLAQEEYHPYAIAVAAGFTFLLHCSCSETQAALEQAEAVIIVSTEYGYQFWLTMATVVRDWALAEQGYAADSIIQMRKDLVALREIGIEAARPWLLTLLAGIYGKAGQMEAGFDVLTEALTLMNKTNERGWEAEAYRQRGELLLQQGNAESQAEACFFQALEIARRQQAKLWELRTTVSLARLWHVQGSPGKRTEADQMLSEIYNWFTEGFDTVDLQEARALLEELRLGTIPGPD